MDATRCQNHEKFEVLHIANKLNISVNECVGALIRLWSISITDFPEGTRQTDKWNIVFIWRSSSSHYEPG